MSLTYQLQPGGTLQGHVRVPGDKSMSHRSVMFGALANGVTEVEGFLEGEDALFTLAAFQAMGVRIDRHGAGRLSIHGVGPEGIQRPAQPLYLGNAGTGMRLLVGLLAGLKLPATLTGDVSLSRRPMRRVTDPLMAMGAQIDTGEGGVPPLVLRGNQPLHSIDYTCPMASAQVKSCVLLAGLHASGTTTVHEPGITRDHTERMLRGFGVEVHSDGLSVSLRGGQRLQAQALSVPGDISSAAFFLVGAAMVPGSDVTLEGVGMNPTRTGVIDILRLMGAQIDVLAERLEGGEPVADLQVLGSALSGIEVPESLVSLAIDEFPALFVAAAGASGTTVVTGAAELRVKETDRIQVMVDGLCALGVTAQARADGVVIQGGGLRGGTVDSAGDHRTAMAFSMAALLAEAPVTVLDCDNVATSFPDFVTLAAATGLRIEPSPGERQR